MLNVKKAGPADIALIRELAMKIWPPTYMPIIGAQQVAYMIDLFYSQEALIKQMEQLHHRFIICFDDQSAIGFASYGAVDNEVFKLHKLYILPEMQGKGAGKYMVNYIAKELQSEGVKYLRLNVNRYNANAIAFYEKAGFRHHMEEDIDIGHGYFMNDHVLEREL